MRRLAVGLFILVALDAASTVFAQSSARGRLTGRVSDSSGLPLPGVTVLLTREARPPIVTHTDEVGQYSFDVPRGVYTLTAELSGFLSAVRPNLVVAAEPLAVDLVLEIGGFSVETQVVAQAPRVFTSAEPTAPATVDKEIIKMAPVQGMRYDSALPLLPGVVRGPDGLVSMGGARAWQGTVVVDRMRETDPLSGEPSLTLSITSVDTVQVYAPAPPAEAGPGTGGLTLVNTKAAADSFNFNIFGIVPRPRFGEGVTTGFESWNPVIGVSGPLVKDHVWLSQSFEYRWERFQFETVKGKQDSSVKGWVSFTRLDVKPRGSHHLSGRLAVYPETNHHFGLDAFSPSASVPDLDRAGLSVGLIDRVALGNEATVETRLHLKRQAYNLSPVGFAPYVIGHDGVTGSYFKTVDRTAYRLEGSTAWSRSLKLWRGDHLVKAGALAAYVTLDGTVTARPADYLRSNGTLSRRIEFAGPGRLETSQAEVGFFVQDTWNVRPGLRVDLGLRADTNSIAAGVALWPRATWAYALRANTTKVSGGLGVFVDKPVLQPAVFAQRQSRIERRYDAAGLPLGPPRLYSNRLIGRLANPRSTIWNLQIDHQLSAGWMLRAGYQERLGRREYVVRPEPLTATDGSLGLYGDGESRARSADATAGYRSGQGKLQVYMSYVRSMSRGNQNDLNTVVGNFESPVVLPDEQAPLSADVPHRFLAWGMIALPWSLTLSPFVEVRSGFPYTRVDENWDVVGRRNDARYPLFVSLDLAVEKAFTLPFGLPVRLGLKFFNIAGRDNGRSVQRDVERPDFGQTYDPLRRQLRGTLEIAWSRAR